ncbi:pyridoxamine 5'-phosphate oxidase family protein [Fibrivirga algicola]|uniref:Pyridoxamine 5'-phosphate oxidase family protein n=1 Tax=Fibrivirga algicola TaxID=2950420 RepID=A0ABX0QMQ7_9BACT|nr:pyridoxamine 5'-phosphate oxidase family protein [Fibrivirga algicola]ARK11575.1 pyridoxamine 5'-phosphate oxidase [Fibrella sp. ES10-3-2-2]NID12561.1 pyridoxamine 5'-phosphate oxidase family protein [Fibrivirga algicola]
METQQQKNAGLEKIKTMVDDIRIAMMTTVDEQGNLVSRPMACMQMDADGTFWFFTAKSSPKVEQVEHNERKVNLSFADAGDSDFVSISGTAQEIDNRAKIDELWSDMAKPWFPKGKEDPELTLLKVHTEMAEYWDSNDSRIVRLFEMARAAITGDTYKEGENVKITN